MIVYAADRAMNIIGMATTALRRGLTISDDAKIEDVETGVASFELTSHYTADTRRTAESMFEVGNYLLRADGDDRSMYTITEANGDTGDMTITAYAEDAGLDLLNSVRAGCTESEAHSIAYYVEKCIEDTGFEIGMNTFGSARLALAFEEQTAKERMDSIAAAFGAEISYGFEIDGMIVSHMYVHIHKKRGKNNGVQLRLNRDISRIRIEKNINDLATGLIVVGGTGDNSDVPINLEGYSYDDGDFYVSGKNLYSREALKRWARFLPDARRQATGVSAHIMRTFRSDTVSQQQLCEEAIAQLSVYREAAVNYEVDIVKLPEGTALGDTVYIIDEAGELYLQSRILKLETRVSEDKKVATLGDFLIRGGGITETVNRLAAEFAELVKTRKLYTWVVYADSGDGTGISTDPDGKAYMGISPNHLQEEPDLSDPTVYAWSLVQGTRGSRTLRVTTAPSSYTTQVGDFTPRYRILLSTVMTQSGVSDVSVGDIIERNYYHYPVGYVDGTYAYLGNYSSIRGAAGAAGKDATLLRIDSSRGVLFKNNVFNTVLTVTIYEGAEIITDAAAMVSKYGAGAYLQWYWRKFEDEDWSVMLVTDSHITNDGFTLTVTPNDVDEKIVFKCELIV